MAPQTDEFGTKVGLLAGLVVLCAARPLIDRCVPEPKSAADRSGVFASAWRSAEGRRPGVGRRRGTGRSRGGGARVILAAGIVVAGTPARGFVGRDTPSC